MWEAVNLGYWKFKGNYGNNEEPLHKKCYWELMKGSNILIQKSQVYSKQVKLKNLYLHESESKSASYSLSDSL